MTDMCDCSICIVQVIESNVSYMVYFLLKSKVTVGTGILSKFS